MDRQNMIYLYNGMLFDNKKEWTCGTFQNKIKYISIKYKIEF